MKWIRVNDRLPKNGGYIMVTNNDSLPFIAMFHEDTGNVTTNENETYKLQHQLTHWMPLPSPPKDN